MSLRNIAIIAHVDHGKTTLVDQLLRQSGAVEQHRQIAERALDSNDLERERGITILAKAISIHWRDLELNIVDTPGHADFGGEVERILSMVDGAILLVDAAEGPLPQTKFVLGKALRRGLRPILVVNKVDRGDARPHEVHDEVFDLFAALGANDEQLDFPTLFASGRDGWAAEAPEGPKGDLTPLFELIMRHVPPPHDVARADAPFAMLTTLLEANPYLGRLLTGRIEAGTLSVNQPVQVLGRDGRRVETGRITKILKNRGLEQVPIDQAEAGDIVVIAGLEAATVADTICDAAVSQPIPAQPIDPPTITMTFGPNDSPLAGREGTKLTSRQIAARLEREAEGNVAIRIDKAPGGEAYEVSGRGELQLSVLIETMRREGFELSVSRPRVVTREEGGQKLEPVEEVTIDVDEEFSGTVIQKLTERRGQLIEMKPSGGGKQRLILHVPARGLIGYHGEFLTDTRGTGLLNRVFLDWAPWSGTMPGRRAGALISTEQGEAVAYALWNLEERGPLFIDPGAAVYQGMIVGEHNRGTDLDVNVLKTKKLTNIRAAGKDDAILLTPPIRMTLERAISYIEDDELLEVTPKTIRLRKKLLLPHERKRAEKAAG